VSIPIFLDSAFVILNPLVKALSRRTGKSVVTLGIALGIGLAATHHAVPPTPGPVGVAGIFGADLGMMILSGLVFSVSIIFFIVHNKKRLGINKIYLLHEEEVDGFFRPNDSTIYEEYLNAAAQKEKELPTFMKSIMPILIPIILIFFNTTLVTLSDTGVIS